MFKLAVASRYREKNGFKEKYTIIRFRGSFRKIKTLFFMNKNIQKIICHEKHDAGNFLILFCWKRAFYWKVIPKWFQNKLKSLILTNICKKIEYINNNCNEYNFKSCISKREKDQKNFFYGWLHLFELGNKLITDDINNFLNFISN